MSHEHGPRPYARSASSGLVIEPWDSHRIFYETHLVLKQFVLTNLHGPNSVVYYGTPLITSGDQNRGGGAKSHSECDCGDATPTG